MRTRIQYIFVVEQKEAPSILSSVSPKSISVSFIVDRCCPLKQWRDVTIENHYELLLNKPSAESVVSFVNRN